MTEFTYQQLKSKYSDFSVPMADIKAGGKSFGKNKDGMIIGAVEVEVTSGVEAAEATYRIHNCVDSSTGMYRTDALKPFILLGTPVQIDMGYGGSLTEVFRGIVCQVQFVGEEEEAPCVEVTAMDIKGIMMAGSYARQMRADCYSKAVREIFDKPAYQKLVSQEVVENFHISDTPDASGGQKKESPETIEMVSESDYEFVVKAAKKFNYEFFQIKSDLYFRKAREVKGTLIELGPKQGLLGSRISYDIRGLVQNVEARGMNTGKGEAISSRKKFNNKISQGNKAKSLISKTEKIYIDSSIRNKEQAESRVDALMEQMAFRFGEMEGVCVGIPELMPGNFVEIKGLGDPVDNRFYLVQARHRISPESGYRTSLTAQAQSLEKG